MSNLQIGDIEEGERIKFEYNRNIYDATVSEVTISSTGLSISGITAIPDGSNKKYHFNISDDPRKAKLEIVGDEGETIVNRLGVKPRGFCLPAV